MAGEESLLSNSVSTSQASVGGVKSRDGFSLNLSISNFPPLISKSGTKSQNLGFKEKWSSLVSIKAPSEDCSLERQDSVLMDENKGVGLSSMDFEDQTKDCKKLVIGFFADKKLPFDMVKEAITKLWEPKSEVTISIHSNRAFVFNFDNDEDRKVALEHGSFYMGTKLFIVRPWSLLIEKSIADLKTIPVWVLIYNVPLHLWNKLGLSSIATFLGNPLMMDEHTMKKTRLSYARVCVEINFDCSFPNQIPLWIDGVHIMDLPVEYPWKPSKCSKCSSFGHTTSSCSIARGKKKAHWTPKKIQPFTKDVERISVENIVEPIPLVEMNNEVNVEVVNCDVPQEKGVGASEQEISMAALEHSSASDSQFQVAEKMNEDRAQPTNHEFLWTYAKRNKKSGKKTDLTKPVATSHLNPFEVLFQDGELLEQGLVRGSSSVTEDESNVSMDGRVSEIWNSDEDANEDPIEVAREEHENVSKAVDTSAESSEDDIEVGNVKFVEEVSKYKPKTKEQHMDGLLGFSSILQLGRGGKEEEVKNIFKDIVGVSKPTKDLGPCSEDLGRGKRTPMPKKKS